MINIGIGTAGLAAFLGYLVDFFGIILLMVVIIVMGKIMYKDPAKQKAPKAKPVKTVDLGSVNVPAGSDLKKVAVMMAVIADIEEEA
ncbi:MAG: OadG family protein [Firmicutes bacterium]|nr:OadG family protein [Bacillota bacterium]